MQYLPGRFRILTIAALLLVTGLHQPALAQPSGISGIEEIVVTARRREETVQTTPVSMSAFSTSGIEARSLSSFNEIGNFVPNLDINGGIPNGGGSAAQLFIRGVGQDDYSFPNEPGVGLYFDDVYISRSVAGDFGFMDIERIEVLRGPQGTLYGRNTIGGAVKIIMRKPEGSNSGEFGVTVGDFDRLDFYANYDFGLSDTTALKVAAATFNRDGLGSNIIGQELGNEEEIDARASLRIQPSDSLDVILVADYMHQKQNGPAGSMVRFDALDPGTDGLINRRLAPATAQEFGLQPPEDTYGAAYVRTLDACDDCVYDSGGAAETRDWADVYGLSATVDWELAGGNLFRSISAVRDYDIDVRRDSEHTPFDIVRVDNPEQFTQFSQEFQLSGLAVNEKLDWVVGFYGLVETGESELLAPLLSGSFAAVGLDLTAFIETEYDAFSLAAFGEGTYHLTDRLGLTLGARITHDDKKYIYGLSRPESGQVPLPPEKLTSDWTEFLPKVGLEFQQTEDLLWYTSFGRGYKAGGYNSRALSGIAPKAYDPEFVNAFEVGFKSALAGGRVTLNGAAFYNDYQDIQLLAVLDLGGGNVETVIENAGQGRIIGAELEVVAVPSDRLELTAGFGVLDTKYDEVGDSATGAGILESNTFINAPDLNFNGSAQYEFGLGRAGALVVRTDLVHKTHQYRDAVNTPELRAGAYTLWNARATWSPAGGNWRLAAFVTNITDELYVTNGVSVLGLGYVEAYYNRPREWGLTLTADFGN